MNVAHPALVDKSKIYFPALHIKLNLIKIFVKAMDKESQGFASLRQKFPKISEATKKEGILIGPHIKQLFKDQDFSIKLNSTERKAWNIIKQDD